MFFSYVALAIMAVPMVHWLGMLGFLYVWLAIELFQTVRIVGLNQELFAHTGEHHLRYVYRLLFLSAVGLVGAGILLTHTYAGSYKQQFAAAFGISSVLAIAAFFLFDVRLIARKVSSRVARRWDKTKA